MWNNQGTTLFLSIAIDTGTNFTLPQPPDAHTLTVVVDPINLEGNYGVASDIEKIRYNTRQLLLKPDLQLEQ